MSFVLFAAVGVALGYLLKDGFLASYLLTLFTSQFITPNKYYPVVLIQQQDFVRGLKTEYISGYCYNAFNIALVMTAILFVRQIYFRKIRLSDLNTVPVKITLVSAILFMVIALGPSMAMSPFPALSFVWVLQYIQTFVLAIVTMYVIRKYGYGSMLCTLAMVVLLQTVIGTLQFFRQGPIGIPFEATRGQFHSGGLDENNALLRSPGTFAYHNQMAVIALALTSVLLPFALQATSPILVLSAIGGLILVLLAQGRTIWLATLPVLTLAVMHFPKEVHAIIGKIGKVRLLVYVLMLLAAFSYIIFPRITLSVNAGYEGAGGFMRMKMLSEGFLAFQSNPWTGYGVGVTETAINALFPKGYTSVYPAAVHMAYLQFMLETGIFGLMAFVFPFMFTLRRMAISVKSRSFPSRALRFSFISGMLTFGMYYAVQPHSGTIEFPFLGIILGIGLAGVYLRHE